MSLISLEFSGLRGFLNETDFRAAAPEAEPQLLAPRRQGHEYSADERGGWFYLRSNRHATNFRVLAAPV
ncbi:MAG TPA: hypothetical protein PLP20_01010, partial [Oscillospiraceae bacterium]|nr:hypothetical protein [Oscillospiraceae bacterium]